MMSYPKANDRSTQPTASFIFPPRTRLSNSCDAQAIHDADVCSSPCQGLPPDNELFHTRAASPGVSQAHVHKVIRARDKQEMAKVIGVGWRECGMGKGRMERPPGAGLGFDCRRFLEPPVVTGCECPTHLRWRNAQKQRSLLRTPASRRVRTSSI